MRTCCWRDDVQLRHNYVTRDAGPRAWFGHASGGLAATWASWRAEHLLGAWCGLVEGGLMFLGVWGREIRDGPKPGCRRCNAYARGFENASATALPGAPAPGFAEGQPPHQCEGLTATPRWAVTWVGVCGTGRAMLAFPFRLSGKQNARDMCNMSRSVFAVIREERRARLFGEYLVDGHARSDAFRPES